MRKYFVLFIFIIPLNLSGQKDTIIYFSASGRSIDSEINAVFFEKITKESKKNYLSTTFSRQGEKWVRMYETKIKKETDSSLTLSSKSLINQKTKRFYHKTDNGYLIKDYIGSVLVQEGFSKLIFPVIKFGQWRGYDLSTGKLKTKESYSENQLITNKYWINDKEFINDVFYMADKVAEFEGGDTALLNFISGHTRYPKYAFKKKITGIVIVRLIVMKDGTIKGIDLLKKANKFLDVEALRVVKSIPNKWNPAEIENKKVNILIFLPIDFRITYQ